jgi:beta-xylosidase
VDAEGKTWLFFNAGFVAPLTDDGLSLAGPARKVYDGWAYPEDWDVEGFSQEGPQDPASRGLFTWSSPRAAPRAPRRAT